MEKKNDLQIFRLRTTGAAIADGYRLYLGNFRRLFRSSWIMAAVYAVAACVFTKVSISLAPEMAILSYLNIDPSAALSALGMLPVWLALSSLLFLLASVAMAAYGFLVMSEHQESGIVGMPAKWYGRISWKMLGRTLAATLSIMLLYAVAQAVVIAAAWAARHFLSATAAAILLGLLQLILLAAFVPAAYCGMKYVLTPKAPLFPTLASAYPAGLRHWGALFVVMLIAADGLCHRAASRHTGLSQHEFADGHTAGRPCRNA